MITEFARKNTFSRILAAAITELLPGAKIAQAGLCHHGFFCDFTYSFPISGGLLERLEERMRQVIRENREIRILEMVPFSASELFKKLGQKERSLQVLSVEGLVQVMSLGGFADWCEEGECLSSTGAAGAFRLLNQIELDRGCIRIFGIGAGSKKELKELSSNWDLFEKRDHERAGSSLGLWRTDGGVHRLWLPRGLEVRGQLSAFWQSAFSSLAEPVEGGEGALELLAQNVPSSMEYVSAEGGEGGRGLLDWPCSLTLSLNHFLGLQSFCTSFLQTIHKSLTILGFDYRIRCFGKRRKGSPLRGALEELGWDLQEVDADADPKLEILVEDALRCEWALAEIGEMKLKGLRGLFATVWVERNLALLIEKSDGSLPFWLAPEHLRVLPISEEQEEAARSEAEFFRAQGFRAVAEKVSGRTLSERIRSAEEAKVPFIAILGEREIKNSHLAWREIGKIRQETGSREQLKRLMIENK